MGQFRSLLTLLENERSLSQKITELDDAIKTTQNKETRENLEHEKHRNEIKYLVNKAAIKKYFKE